MARIHSLFVSAVLLKALVCPKPDKLLVSQANALGPLNTPIPQGSPDLTVTGLRQRRSAAAG
jgi:hypothetical protein